MDVNPRKLRIMEDSLLQSYKNDFYNLAFRDDSLENLSKIIKSATAYLSEEEFNIFSVFALAQMRQVGYNNGVKQAKEDIISLVK